ncbi:MAG: hypothetical protein MRY64_15630 [Hyphomonadaceae bacterium]|nr:hypothetical protein [Hyphomonadaceae bacterium]
MAEARQVGGGGSPFSGNVVGIILGVSGLAFLFLMVFIAWGPELQSRDRAGPHPYSTSALGYQGLFRLLEARGIPVTISRSARRLDTEYSTLKILTLTPYGMEAALEEMDLVGPALVVLPKWGGYTDPQKPSWQEETYILRSEQVESVLQVFDSDAGIWRLRTPASLKTPFGKFDAVLGDDMQVLRADSLVSIVPVAGGDLIAKLPDRDVYILADPDLLNTSGLAEAENARFTLAMVNWIRWGSDDAVLLDATLHGFERSENLLQMVFDIPFVGATLAALAAFLMIGWAGAVRFGAPLPEERAFALGKQALTDNTAGLIAMGRRETRLAPGYLSLIRRATAKAVGAPRSLTETELAQMFDRMGAEDAEKFTQLEASLHQPAASREDLMDKARRLWRWHKEITHGHS